jgi:hypothetical protein
LFSSESLFLNESCEFPHNCPQPEDRWIGTERELIPKAIRHAVQARERVLIAERRVRKAAANAALGRTAVRGEIEARMKQARAEGRNSLQEHEEEARMRACLFLFKFWPRTLEFSGYLFRSFLQLKFNFVLMWHCF